LIPGNAVSPLRYRYGWMPNNWNTFWNYYWYYIHFLTINYPEHPTEDDKAEIVKFTEMLASEKGQLCRKCRLNLQKYVERHPIRGFHHGRKILFRYFVDLHNNINLKLHKPTMDEREAEDIYGQSYWERELQKFGIDVLQLFRSRRTEGFFEAIRQIKQRLLSGGSLGPEADGDGGGTPSKKNKKGRVKWKDLEEEGGKLTQVQGEGTVQEAGVSGVPTQGPVQKGVNNGPHTGDRIGKGQKRDGKIHREPGSPRGLFIRRRPPSYDCDMEIDCRKSPIYFPSRVLPPRKVRIPRGRNSLEVAFDTHRYTDLDRILPNAGTGTGTGVVTDGANPFRTVLDLSPLDLNRLTREDGQQPTPRYRVGVCQPVNKTVNQMGSWHRNAGPRALPGRWSHAVRCENVTGLMLLFEDLRLSRDSRMEVRCANHPSQAQVLTHLDNNRTDRHTLGPFWDDCVTLSYTEASRPLRETRDRAVPVLASVGKLYRKFPSGDDPGIGRIVALDNVSLYLMSGFLVNNGRRDMTPYFLTSQQCTTASNNDRSHWQFRWRAFNTTGCTHLSSSNDDCYALLKLDNLQPKQALENDLTFHGWDRKGSLSANATINGSKVSAHNDRESHWRIGWNHPASAPDPWVAGSPLSDQNDAVIGILTSTDRCSRFSHIWNHNSKVGQPLSFYLDPDQEGRTHLERLEHRETVHTHQVEDADMNNDIYDASLNWQLFPFSRGGNGYHYFGWNPSLGDEFAEYVDYAPVRFDGVSLFIGKLSSGGDPSVTLTVAIRDAIDPETPGRVLYRMGPVQVDRIASILHVNRGIVDLEFDHPVKLDEVTGDGAGTGIAMPVFLCVQVNGFKPDSQFAVQCRISTRNRALQRGSDGSWAGYGRLTGKHVSVSAGIRPFVAVRHHHPMGLEIMELQGPGYQKMGSLKVKITGGTPPYQYKISTTDIDGRKLETVQKANASDNPHLVENLAAGDYVLTVKDTTHSVKQMFNIPEFAQLDLVLAATNVSENDRSDGTIRARPTGGQPPYRMSLNGGPWTTVPLFDGLPGGSYRVTVADGGDREVSKRVILGVFLFGAESFVTTDQGDVRVDLLSPKNTIKGQPIRSVYRAKISGGNLVEVSRGALGDGSPSVDSRFTGNYRILHDGKLVRIDRLINGRSIRVVKVDRPVDGYSVLMERHQMIRVNHLPVESLHPDCLAGSN